MLLAIARIALLVLSVFAAAWLLVIFCWRAADADPGGAALIIWLLLFPALLLTGLLAWLQRATIARWLRTFATPASDTLRPPSPTAGNPDHIGRSSHGVSLIDAALRLPLGEDVQSAAAALSRANQRPGLDTQLVDSQGFPVFAARVPGPVVDHSALKTLLEPPESPPHTRLDWSLEQMRALSLAAQVLDDLSGGLLARFTPAQTPPAPSLLGDQAEPQTDRRHTRLCLGICLPANWLPDHQDAARHWLAHRLQAAELALFEISVASINSQADTAPLAFIDQWMAHPEDSSHSDFCVLLALDCAVGEHSVARWEDQGLLFHQGNPRGRIPAEGAAAVLLATDAVSQAIQPLPWLRLHPLALGRRDKSADEKGRVTGELLLDLARNAVTTAGCEPADIISLITDAGLQAGRAVESGALLSADFNHLDGSAQCLPVGAACGWLGAVNTVAALALAAHMAGEDDAPVLVLGSQHGTERAAAVVQPHAAAAIALGVAEFGVVTG